MTTTVGDFLVERLYRWGVRRIYGYPGDGINGVFGALNRANGKIAFIQARHEEMAAFMASAHAKFTGELGVCIATSGPGASHLLTGLYDARMDHQPVLAIVGQQARAALGGHYQQELDLLSMFKDVAGAFVQQASTPAQVRHLLDRAVRTAVGERRVTAIILPNDLQDLPYEAPARATAPCILASATASRGCCPTRLTCNRPPTCSMPGARWPCWSVPAHCRRANKWRRWPKSSGRAWPRRCWARPCFRTPCPGSPVPSACSAPSRATS